MSGINTLIPADQGLELIDNGDVRYGLSEAEETSRKAEIEAGVQALRETFQNSTATTTAVGPHMEQREVPAHLAEALTPVRPQHYGHTRHPNPVQPRPSAYAANLGHIEQASAF